MENRDSSDEEGDLEHLIDQNDRKHLHQLNHNHTHSSPRRSSFNIEELDSRIRHRLWSFPNLNKRYLLVAIVFLPLLLLLYFSSTGVRSFFSSKLSLQHNSLLDKMHESELQALYLLQQQQLSLFTLYNHSSSSNSSLQNSNFSSTHFDFLPKIESMINLNKQIQETLLASHKTGNVSSDSRVSSDGYFDKCKKVDQKFSERKTIEWKPKSDKFLFALCLSGQMSNHLICIEKHMFFAALLNRVLVMPSAKFDYQYSRVLDIEHINQCLGRKVVIFFEEFVEMKKNHVNINKFICYVSSPKPCYVDDEHLKRLKGLGISIGGNLESPWKEDIKNPTKRTVHDVISKFGVDDDVIAIGEVFYANVEEDWVMQPGGPLAHKCKILIEPTNLIMVTAQRFVQTFLGSNFIALHFRRHGFLKFCNAKKPSCFYPIPQAADCIARVVERANAPVIYLSTDAADSETGLLQSLVVVNGKTIPLVKRPSHNSVEKWDSLLSRHGIEEDPQVVAMLDKTICALSHVFIGASGSTFTDDILRLRKGWGSASLCDEFLCEGELPNFIAEDE